MESSSEHKAQALKLFQGFQNEAPDAIEGILALFSPTAKFYMYGPHKPPMDGLDEIKEGLGGMLAMLKDFKYRILNMAENGNILFVERVEEFTFMEKHHVEVSVVSVSRLGSEGKFVEFTDYFDSAVLAGLS